MTIPLELVERHYRNVSAADFDAEDELFSPEVETIDPGAGTLHGLQAFKGYEAAFRRAFPDGKLVLIWDGAPYHRAKAVRAAAAELGIELAPLPGYSPDLMPVEALWRWLREDVTYHHCHSTADDLTRRVAAFEARINQAPCTIADRLWVKHHLDPSEEKLRFSK